MSNKKKIFSISMVKNEMDIIESFVRYNTCIFDGMIILENGSTDDTLKILNLLKEEGLSIVVIEDAEKGFDKVKKFQQLSRIAVDEFKADIIVPIDADEFLISTEGGNPRGILEKLESPSYYVIDWKTYVPDFKNEDVKFIPSLITLSRDRSAEDLQKVIIPGKMVTDYNVKIARGSHRIISPPKYEDKLKKQYNPDLMMAHFPIRSREQTISKISIGWMNALSSPERKEGQSFHWEKIFNSIKNNDEIKNEDLTAFAREYSLMDHQINEEIQLNEDPMDLSFCKDITIKYTPDKLNPLSNLLEACENLSSEYVKLKKETVAQEKGDRKLTTSEYIKENEEVYKDLEEIKYVFCKKEGSDKLIISFPGFTDKIGTFKYSYVRTLKDVNAHRLFVLDDFGTRGSYLLGRGREFTVEKTVLSLIGNILKKYNIKKENVILQGSSKGGWIALYYGIKYHFGHVIAGGPQTKMGRFLVIDEVNLPESGKVPLSSKVNVADYISGGHEKEDIEYLDGLLFNLIYKVPPEDFPEIFIHVGKEDFHYPHHVLPFTHKLDEVGARYQLDLEEYDVHNELAVYYPEYLINTLEIIDSSLVDAESKDPMSQNSILQAKICQLEYHRGKNRSLQQKLITRFPSLFILLNRDNHGIKNALINLKGFGAIKRNQLFDIGYYLNNYSDVRRSGADPLLHYLYSGYKEGRKPNPAFDGNNYLRKHQDVLKAGMNPLVHYALYGMNEERVKKQKTADTQLYRQLEDGTVGGVIRVDDFPVPSLAGWLVKIGDETPREAVLKIDGHHVLDVICDSSDSDLMSSKLMEGHGFQVPVPYYFIDGRMHHIELYDKLTGELITQDKTRIVQTRVFTDFSGYLSYSIVSPMVHAPFREQDKRCFAVMENVAHNLQGAALKMEDHPLVSVVMYVKNDTGSLESAVESVLNQTYPNIELLIVDDASVDGSGELLEKINGESVIIISNESYHGVSRSRNMAVSRAQGKYIAYLDPGNIWDQNYIMTMIGAFRELSDADALYSGQLLFKNEEVHPYAVRFGSLNRALLKNRNYMDINAFCHTIDVYRRLGGFDETPAHFAEWDWFLKVAESGQVYSVPVVLSNSLNEPYNPEDKAPYTLESGESLTQNPGSIPEIHKGVSVVIPSYESLEDIRECIESILLLDAGEMPEIVVVDNASSGPVVEYLSGLKDEGKIKLILNDINYGFTYAVNQGISIAESGNDIVILNNDAVVTPGAIGNMQKASYELPECGLVVPQQVLLGGSGNISQHVPYANPQKECDVNPSGLFENIIHVPLFHAGRVLELNFAPFFCVYIKRDVLDSSVGLDAEFGRHYRSDRIFCNYIRHVMKLKIYHVSDAVVYHKEQQSTKILKNESKADFDIMFHKNQWDEKLAKELGYKKPQWDI